MRYTVNESAANLQYTISTSLMNMLLNTIEDVLFTSPPKELCSDTHNKKLEELKKLWNIASDRFDLYMDAVDSRIDDQPSDYDF